MIRYKADSRVSFPGLQITTWYHRWPRNKTQRPTNCPCRARQNKRTSNGFFKFSVLTDLWDLKQKPKNNGESRMLIQILPLRFSNSVTSTFTCSYRSLRCKSRAIKNRWRAERKLFHDWGIRLKIHRHLNLCLYRNFDLFWQRNYVEMMTCTCFAFATVCITIRHLWSCHNWLISKRIWLIKHFRSFSS